MPYDETRLVKTENPEIIEIISLCKERRYNLSDFKAKKVNGIKYCAWCYKNKLRKGRRKWCSDKCADSAFITMNPQILQSAHEILLRQDYKCNKCQFDYKTLLKQESLENLNLYTTLFTIKCKVARLNKNNELLPEVDHIKPIALGGQALGLDNHQVLCRQCHKTKTKQDMSDIAELKRENAKQ